jgi:hypothetical protein
MMMPPARTPSRSPLTDSPWFWVAVFSAAAMLFLLVITPRYRPRQRRLEMQYMAREEMLRRRAEGEPLARASGQEGELTPPAENELIVPLWPLGLLFGLLSIASAAMLWRSRGPLRSASELAERGPP